MAANMDEAEHLRGDALRIGTGLLRLMPAGEPDQAVDWNPSLEDSPDDYVQLLNAVDRRFANRTDGAGNTRARLAELVESYLDSVILRSRLHAQVCLLLAGHTDLFNRFQRLRFMNDGSQETRNQIRQWEYYVRFTVMMKISSWLADCISAIENLTMTPVKLSGRDLGFIAAEYFTSDDLTTAADANMRFHELRSLVMNPISVRDQVLPTLRNRLEEYQLLEFFLANYFGQVASMDI